jgi:PAS domain-containing protein
MLDEYRRRYEEFNTISMREHYLFLSGQKESLQIAPIFEAYRDLFERTAIDQLSFEFEATPHHFEAARRSLLHLQMFAIEQFLEDSVKHLTEAVNDYESSATVQWNGRSMTFHDTAVALASEPDRETRRVIYSKREAIVQNSNDLRQERVAKLHDAARQLGHSGYRTLFESLRQLDYSAIAFDAELLLDQTEQIFVESLSPALSRSLGLSLDQAERHDAVFFLHLSDYDDWFPVNLLLPVYKSVMARLGVDVDSQSHISIDSEPRPRKTARAFCMPVSVPDDVKLVIRPSGGQSDYQSLLHESGHAQHYGWTSASLPPEFKYTGDYALTETYAFLFNHLVSDPDWLATFLGFADSAEFVRSLMLARLVTIRRYAAKLIYEIRLHDGESFADAANAYAELQTSATRFRTDPTDYLFDLDDGFYCAGYLRAWALEVALRDHLKIRFGRQWWTSPKAGSLLKELWEIGDRYNADEIAKQIGIGPISLQLLTEEFNTALR